MAIGQNEETKIIEAVHGLGLSGDDEGIIEAFGVLLTNNYADYYNTLSFEFEKDKKDPLAGLAESVGYVRGVLAGITDGSGKL